MIVALAALAIMVAAAVYISSCKGKKTEVTSISSEDSVKQVLARGEYLAHYVA